MVNVSPPEGEVCAEVATRRRSPHPNTEKREKGGGRAGESERTLVGGERERKFRRERESISKRTGRGRED